MRMYVYIYIYIFVIFPALSVYWKWKPSNIHLIIVSWICRRLTRQLHEDGPYKKREKKTKAKLGLAYYNLIREDNSYDFDKYYLVDKVTGNKVVKILTNLHHHYHVKSYNNQSAWNMQELGWQGSSVVECLFKDEGVCGSSLYHFILLWRWALHLHLPPAVHISILLLNREQMHIRNNKPLVLLNITTVKLGKAGVNKSQWADANLSGQRLNTKK